MQSDVDWQQQYLLLYLLLQRLKLDVGSGFAIQSTCKLLLEGCCVLLLSASLCLPSCHLLLVVSLRSTSEDVTKTSTVNLIMELFLLLQSMHPTIALVTAKDLSLWSMQASTWHTQHILCQGN